MLRSRALSDRVGRRERFLLFVGFTSMSDWKLAVDLVLQCGSDVVLISKSTLV